jgi:hypothetical protein
MTAGFDVRVDADRDPRLAPASWRARTAASARADSTLKQAMSCARAKRISSSSLQAPEKTTRRVAAGREHPRQLAAGDDVEAGAARSEHAEHGEIAVRLDGIADARPGGRRRPPRRRRSVASSARGNTRSRACRSALRAASSGTDSACSCPSRYAKAGFTARRRSSSSSSRFGTGGGCGSSGSPEAAPVAGFLDRRRGGSPGSSPGKIQRPVHAAAGRQDQQQGQQNPAGLIAVLSSREAGV